MYGGAVAVVVTLPDVTAVKCFLFEHRLTKACTHPSTPVFPVSTCQVGIGLRTTLLTPSFCHSSCSRGGLLNALLVLRTDD